MSQVLCQVPGNGDSKETRDPILMEFRTRGETETNVKSKCDSANNYKEDIQRALNQVDQRRHP